MGKITQFCHAFLVLTAAVGTTKITQKLTPSINYTVSRKKEASSFSTISLAFLDQFS